MKLTGEDRQLGEKPVPVPLCPPQISHGLIRDRTRAFAVRGRRLTAWAMGRQFSDFKVTLFFSMGNCRSRSTRLYQWLHEWLVPTIVAIDANLIIVYDWPIFKHILKFFIKKKGQNGIFIKMTGRPGHSKKTVLSRSKRDVWSAYLNSPGKDILSKQLASQIAMILQK
jgi:hypothetical protein